MGAKASASPASTRSTATASAAMSSRDPAPSGGLTGRPPAPTPHTPRPPAALVQRGSPPRCISIGHPHLARPGCLCPSGGIAFGPPRASELYRIPTRMRQVPLALALCALLVAPGELGAQTPGITLADA